MTQELSLILHTKPTVKGYLQSLMQYMLLLQLFMKKNSIHKPSKKWEENSRNSKLDKAM